MVLIFWKGGEEESVGWTILKRISRILVNSLLKNVEDQILLLRHSIITLA